MEDSVRALGTVESAELLLKELYVDLRHKLREWSEVTKQTPQARMGYVGQHLVSVVTGFPGGRSGARGHDLELPGEEYAEIKTCYRIDQLGQCTRCGAAVASIEDSCPRCGATSILRKDDSKWLVGIRNDDEMASLFQPQWYFLALFDFASAVRVMEQQPEAATEEPSAVVTATPPDINATVWRVDPRRRGFALCMVDYYVNIRAKSKSKAPFNLWPYSLKFQLMRPQMIYHARIAADDRIDTLIFEGLRGEPTYYPLAPLTTLYGSHQNLGTDRLLKLAVMLGVQMPETTSRRTLLDELERHRQSSELGDDNLADMVAELMYREAIRDHEPWLPAALRNA